VKLEAAATKSANKKKKSDQSILFTDPFREVSLPKSVSPQ
jgi:hypothetical protein